MGARVVGVVGSYRRGRTMDTAVATVLEGAAARGAETRQIHLLDVPVQFCTNCRSCMQEASVGRRGRCVQDDGLEALLDTLDAADGLVLGAVINTGSTAALFKRFVERLAPYSYWPWGEARAPVQRVARPDKKAVLVSSGATPSPMRKVMLPYALDPLKRAAGSLGADVVAAVYLGGVCDQRGATLSDSALAKARRAGEILGTRSAAPGI